MVGKIRVWPNFQQHGHEAGTESTWSRPWRATRANEQQGKIAFVLSGGAARGAIQVGMLRVLMQRGLIPDLIVGTSVGAFNGAWLAASPTDAGVQQLEDIWTHMRQEDIFAGGTIGVLLHLMRRLPSLYGGEAIHAFLRRVLALSELDAAVFEHLQVPLAIVATNLTRGRATVFDRGQLIPALLASSAIPAVLPPITIDGEQYVDGGLLDNVGLHVAIERGATQIYVLDTSCDGPASRPATSLEGVIERSIEVVTAFHLQCAVERYADRANVVVLRDDGRVLCNGADFSAVNALIAAGQAIAEETLCAPRSKSMEAIASGHALVHPRLATSVSETTCHRARPVWPAWSAWRDMCSWLGNVPACMARAVSLARPRVPLATLEPPTPLPSREPQRAAS